MPEDSNASGEAGVPAEPQGQMAEVVLDVTDVRFMKVVASRSDYTVEKVTPTSFIVRKGASTYFVNLEKADGKPLVASCNCPDWNFHARKFGVPCKHIWLVAEQEGLVSFPPKDLLVSEAKDDDGKDGIKKGKGVPVKDAEREKVDGPDDWTVD